MHEVKEHTEFFTRMIKSMTIAYDGVLPTADKIIAQLGGRQSYIGIHVRVSDVDSFQRTVLRTLGK